MRKHFRGYEIMKDVMYKHSHKEGTVAKFEYNPADAQVAEPFRARAAARRSGRHAAEDCAGMTTKLRPLFESHSNGKPYVIKNYREVLCRMEQEGKIRMDRRCRRGGKGTIWQKM